MWMGGVGGEGRNVGMGGWVRGTCMFVSCVCMYLHLIAELYKLKMTIMSVVLAGPSAPQP